MKGNDNKHIQTHRKKLQKNKPKITTNRNKWEKNGNYNFEKQNKTIFSLKLYKLRYNKNFINKKIS